MTNAYLFIGKITLLLCALLSGCSSEMARDEPYVMLQQTATAVVSIYTSEGAAGSGFVLAGGWVVTNAHMISSGKAMVVLLDGRRLAWRTVIQDKALDLAIGQVEADDLPALPVSIEPLKLAQPVYALGNPYGLGLTVTQGIVSALPEAINKSDLLQVNVDINPGNSGGPLVNTRGQVVAIVNARSAVGSGIGFAVPVDTIQRLLNQLPSQN